MTSKFLEFLIHSEVVFVFIIFQQKFYNIAILFELKQFLLLQTAIPAAVSLVIFAERYNYKIAEITGIVILTSLFSFGFITINYFLSYLIF